VTAVPATDGRAATRRSLAILVVAAAVAGLAVALAAGAIPEGLEAATDIIGYPAYYDFDIPRYGAIAALIGIGWPALTAALALALTRLWRPSSGFWSGPALVLSSLERAEPDCAAALTDAAMLGVAAGLGAAVGLGLGAMPAAGVAVATTAALWFAARGDADRLAVAVAVLAPLGPMLLAIASARTVVTVLEPPSTVAYPWFPIWLAAALAVAGWLTARRLGVRRAARPVAMLWTGLPVLWLLTVELPGAVGAVDLFHEGEMLVGALALLDGRLPWADLHLIHGPWFDAGRALVGMTVLEPTRWGAVAGLHLIVNPLYLTGLAALFAWLFGWRWPHAALATLLAASLDPLVHIRLILWAPLLAALALLLVRATPPRALAVVALGGVTAVLVPEIALGVIAVGATVVLHDAVAGDGGRPWRFRCTLLCAAFSVPVAAALVAALVAVGAWEGFLHHLTVFTRDHALAGGIPIARSLAYGDVVALTAVIVAALALVAAAGGWAAVARWRPDARDWVVVAAALFALLYMPKVVYRADGHVFHALAAAAVPIGVVAVRLLLAVERALPGLPASARRALPHPVLVAALLATAAIGPAWLSDAKESMLARWRYGGPAFDPATVASRLMPTVPAPGAEPMLGYAGPDAIDPAMIDGWRLLLGGWVSLGGTVLDLTNRPALFHALLGYAPAGRFFHISMALRRESQEALIADLDRRPPEAVIVPTGRGWDGIPDTVRHYLVSRTVLERYVPVEAFEDGVLYVPRGTDLADARLYNAAVTCDWGDAGGFLELAAPATGPTEWPAEPQTGPETVRFRGWAIDRATGRPARGVVATLDGRPIADDVPRLPRPDVAAALGSPAAAASGFELTIQVPRGAGRRVRVLAEAADGALRPLDAAPGIDFEGDSGAEGPAAGYLDLRRVEVHDGVRRLARLPLDIAARARLRLVLSGGEPGRRYRLAELPPWATEPVPGAAIGFGSPRGGRVALPLGACPQWWGYRDRPLFLWPEDGRPAPDLSVAWEVAS